MSSAVQRHLGGSVVQQSTPIVMPAHTTTLSLLCSRAHVLLLVQIKHWFYSRCVHEFPVALLRISLPPRLVA